MEASNIIGEAQPYLKAVYAARSVNLPAFEHVVRDHIPRGVPKGWRSVQEYTLKDLQEALKDDMAQGKTQGSNQITGAVIAVLPEPVQGLPCIHIEPSSTGPCALVLARHHWALHRAMRPSPSTTP